MAVRSVDSLLAEFRQLLQAQYDRGGKDALKRFLSAAAKESSNRTHSVVPKHKRQVARTVTRTTSQ